MGVADSTDWFRYPAVFTYSDDGITVEFVDFPGSVTCGFTEGEAVKNAKECLALAIYGAEQDGESISEPTLIAKLTCSRTQALALIEVYMPPYRHRAQEAYVKKNLTIPKWLDELAREHKVNFSQVLQGALKEHLGVGGKNE